MTTPAAPAVLELREVTFRRDGTHILDGIDLTVRAGEHWALLGPNGAGKSTVLGFCGALTFPTSGTVDVLGRRLGRVELQELRRHIGHVNPRHPVRSPLTVTEVVLTGLTGSLEPPMRWEATVEQIARAHELLHSVGLDSRRDARWPTLSQGERGRTLIARALIADPQLLLLDEPTTGLDVAAREQLLETIDGLAHTAPDLASVLVTHHLEELPETTTHALLISHGRIVATGPIEQAVTTETVTRAFEHAIRVERADGRWSARAVRERAAAV
ncbi:ATP-binding cassette domain-containing protein [Leifsonia naganoensis]|uniref:Iron complex transport system ATP-binding protein n=1 Tax=Leifsonia naganoensis TaxID=150025 RepID=A0A853DJF3_9MICO|nr:iron complex transport system ATP-binding protein [Leifsonia naganoensis]